MTCQAGIPLCAAGSNLGVPCSMPVGSPSAGYHVLGLDSDADGIALKTTCPLTGAYKPQLLTQCSMTQADTLLSVFVDYDCSVQISPVGDTACSEPGASGYSYANLTIFGAYSSLTSINTVMPAVNTATEDSFLLSLTYAGAGKLTLSYWAASTNPANAATVLADAACSATVDVNGGQVAAQPSSPASCPAGSYAVSGEYCPPW